MRAPTTVDPILFEIVRHRLVAINEEAASAIGRISGSPVANEAYDLNTALMTSDGDVLVIGRHVMAHAAALDCVVRHVAAEYAENPGIGPLDMFMTNDPYVGAMHQPDVVVVAPIFDGDERILWCGSIVHQTDVGGPMAGSVTTGAGSIYQEAIPLAPVRIVENGRIRKDIEREYLIRSRMPGLNALDMRGQIAANNIQRERVLGVCDRYGTAAVMGVIEHLVDTTAERFRQRLRDLPDGRWRHQCFIEHDGLNDDVYAIRLTMTKTGDRLELDFSETDDQAPSSINCSQGTLRGYALSAVLTLLNADIPWVPAAMWRSIDIKARPGSLVDALWPAGVSMGNTASGHSVRTCVNICIAMMLDASVEHGARAMASCIGSYAGQNISGFWDTGSRFGMLMMEPLGGGGGALAVADGVNTCGQLNAPSAVIGNVEVNEYNCPILYLWRREARDSGGAGRFRGGVGGEHGFVTHHADGSVASTVFGHGIQQPISAGVAGGEPGGPNGYVVVRGRRSLTARSLDELGGRREYLPAKSSTQLSADDVFVQWYAGGGGFGDPIDRAPEAVLEDVREGFVSIADARDVYGVVVTTAEDPSIDMLASDALRARTRAARLGGRVPVETQHRVADQRLSSCLGITGRGEAAVVVCTACGQTLGRVGDEITDYLVQRVSPVTERWPATASFVGAARFDFRRFFCPQCATQAHSEVGRRGTDWESMIETDLG